MFFFKTSEQIGSNWTWNQRIALLSWQKVQTDPSEILKCDGNLSNDWENVLYSVAQMEET